MASRLIARRSCSFRVQPSFSYFRKMNVALCRLQELNMSSEIDGMKNAIKSSCQINGAYHLPTAANFRYFLIRLQSYAKLLVRIVVCAKEAHRLFLEIVHRSAFIETITMFMAVTAQVWTHCVAICQSTVRLYDAFAKFCRKYFDEKMHEALPDNLSEWLGDDWIEHIAVSTRPVTTKSRKYQSNIILFNAFDVRPTRELQTTEPDSVGGDGDDAVTEQRPVTPKFTPKLLINSGMRSINLNDPSKLTYEQRHKAKEHHREEKKIGKKVKREIRAIRTQEKEMRKQAAAGMVDSDATTIDMGEKIDRGSLQPEKKIEKLDKLSKLKKKVDVNQLKSVQAIREFMVTEDMLRQKHNAHASKGIGDVHWKKVKNSVDQLLILGQDRLAVRKFQNLWQNAVKTPPDGRIKSVSKQ